jgi:hypothetical protein
MRLSSGGCDMNSRRKRLPPPEVPNAFTDSGSEDGS